MRRVTHQRVIERLNILITPLSTDETFLQDFVCSRICEQQSTVHVVQEKHFLKIS